MEKFYERVRNPGRWILEFFGTDEAGFNEVMHPSAAGGEYSIWFTEDVKITIEEVDGANESCRRVTKKADLRDIASSSAELFGSRNLDFEVYQHPRGGIGGRPVKQTGLPSGIKDGDLLHIKFEVDCEVNLAVFLISPDSVFGLYPWIDQELLDYGHSPGKSTTSRGLTQFRFPMKGGFEVVVGEKPYFCVAIARDTEWGDFTDVELFDFRKGLKLMKSDYYGSHNDERSTAFDLCSSGMIGRGGWRDEISSGLPPNLSFGELIVIRSAGFCLAS